MNNSSGDTSSTVSREVVGVVFAVRSSRSHRAPRRTHDEWLQDRERVERRFAEARSQGIVVERGAVSPARLAQHLRRHGPAIALVDAGYLACDFCKRNKIKSEIKSLFLSFIPSEVSAARAEGLGRRGGS